jgi:hypothetical protein
VTPLQSIDSQALIRKVFRNKDLEGKIGPQIGEWLSGILRPWPHFDVKELKFCFLVKAVGSSLVSYCSIAMISQMMWLVKDVRHRCDGSATHLWKHHDGVGRVGQRWPTPRCALRLKAPPKQSLSGPPASVSVGRYGRPEVYASNMG